MAADPLGRAAVEALDPTRQLDDVLGLADHLRDALWKVESAQLRPIAGAGLVVAGMGGSAIGGTLAIAAYGPRARKPIESARGYALPPWTTRDHVVLCASYSGATEETLAAYDAAGALGAHRVVATTGGELAERARADGVPVIPLAGGFQPRAAVGYSTVVACEVAAAAGSGPSLRAEIEGAAVLVERLAQEWGPQTPPDSDAKVLARDLQGCIPVVTGAELTAPVAYRWKCQLNENAKVHGFASELPEADHNELVGWAAAGELGRFAQVLLVDPETHPRTLTRFDLSERLVSRGAEKVLRVAPRGETRFERLASLLLLGDLATIYLAVLRGADPAEIDVLRELKRELAAG